MKKLSLALVLVVLIVLSSCQKFSIPSAAGTDGSAWVVEQAVWPIAIFPPDIHYCFLDDNGNPHCKEARQH